MASKGTY